MPRLTTAPGGRLRWCRLRGGRAHGHRLRGERAHGHRLRGERGAASILVAVLLAGGVLLGMTALVVDVGQLYVEREELQSGADAAAFAVALDCVKGRAACTAGGAPSTAGRYADGNARDGRSDAVVCGHDPQGGLNECTNDPVGNLTDCIGNRPTDGTAYVEVRTTTRMADGATLLPPSFAQAVVSGFAGTTVAACARVAWGTPAGGLALTISTCEWNASTNSGTNLAPAPPATPPASAEQVIRLHDSQGATTCPAGPSGWDRPGGFGWLDDGTDRDCQAEIVDDTYGGDTGNSASGACQDALSGARASRTVLLMPVYDGVRGQGQNITYHLAGVAAFVVTGYRLSGFAAASTLTGQNYCAGQLRCLYGYFTETLAPWTGSIGTLPTLGAAVVKTVG